MSNLQRRDTAAAKSSSSTSERGGEEKRVELDLPEPGERHLPRRRLDGSDRCRARQECEDSSTHTREPLWLPHRGRHQNRSLRRDPEERERGSPLQDLVARFYLRGRNNRR